MAAALACTPFGRWPWRPGGGDAAGWSRRGRERSWRVPGRRSGSQRWPRWTRGPLAEHVPPCVTPRHEPPDNLAEMLPVPARHGKHRYDEITVGRRTFLLGVRPDELACCKRIVMPARAPDGSPTWTWPYTTATSQAGGAGRERGAAETGGCQGGATRGRLLLQLADAVTHCGQERRIRPFPRRPGSRAESAVWPPPLEFAASSSRHPQPLARSAAPLYGGDRTICTVLADCTKKSPK